MEYNQTNNKSKKSGSTGFYAIIACCLIILGGASWFAVSRYSDMKKQNESKNSDINSNNSSYNSFEKESSSTPSSEITAGEQSGVPYSSESKISEEKKSFVLPIQGEIIKRYSDSSLQYSSTYGDMRLHTGIDIKCEKNSQIKACGKGTVTDVKNDSSFGKTVVIDHGDGIVLSYCGLNSVSINTGDTVSSGSIIGTIGSIPSESSDGVHLHMSASIDGKICSPLKALGLE